MLQEAEAEKEVEVRGEEDWDLEEGQEAEADLFKAGLIWHKGVKLVWKSRGEEAKEEAGEAGREQSRINTWRRGGTRLRRGRRPEEERGPCLARENQLGEVSPVGQSGIKWSMANLFFKS